MKNLILDCSSGMSVFVQNDEQVFSYVDENQKRHSDELLTIVDNLLNEAGIKIADIENIAVCVGPGSFTGVRVAISMAKGLAVGSKAKLVALNNFEIVDAFKNNNAIIVLDGFSNFIYTCYSGENLVYLCESVDEFAGKYLTSNSDAMVCVLNEKTQNTLKKYKINSILAQTNAIDCANDKIRKSEFVNLNQIVPMYLRASQAEIERNKKL